MNVTENRKYLPSMFCVVKLPNSNIYFIFNFWSNSSIFWLLWSFDQVQTLKFLFVNFLGQILTNFRSSWFGQVTSLINNGDFFYYFLNCRLFIFNHKQTHLIMSTGYIFPSILYAFNINHLTRNDNLAGMVEHRFNNVDN